VIFMCLQLVPPQRTVAIIIKGYMSYMVTSSVLLLTCPVDWLLHLFYELGYCCVIFLDILFEP
jgi:hypothetical protein